MSPDATTGSEPHERSPAGPALAVTARQSLIDELESTISGSETRQGAEVLRRVTDLFVAGSSSLSTDQVELFDDVMCRLVKEVKTTARSNFGQRLATLDAAPPRLVRMLALDDSIEVAGAVLSGYARLDEAVMVEAAKTKSQDHLIALSHRASLSEIVTDVLVERGDRRVAISTATNTGARLSEFGCTSLVNRSQDDDVLALQLWSRPDIPRQYLLKLLADCSENVRRALSAGGRRRADMLRGLVAQASAQLQSQSREVSVRSAAARAHVEALHRNGQLDEMQLYRFARAGQFDETAVALELLCDLPIGVVEHAMVNDGTEQILVIAKAARFSWKTAKAVLIVRPGSRGTSVHEIEQSQANFNKLKPETAEKAMQFYRLREKAAKTLAS